MQKRRKWAKNLAVSIKLLLPPEQAKVKIKSVTKYAIERK